MALIDKYILNNYDRPRIDLNNFSCSKPYTTEVIPYATSLQQTIDYINSIFNQLSGIVMDSLINFENEFIKFCDICNESIFINGQYQQIIDKKLVMEVIDDIKSSIQNVPPECMEMLNYYENSIGIINEYLSMLESNREELYRVIELSKEYCVQNNIVDQNEINAVIQRRTKEYTKLTNITGFGQWYSLDGGR